MLIYISIDVLDNSNRAGLKSTYKYLILTKVNHSSNVKTNLHNYFQHGKEMLIKKGCDN